MTDALLRVPRTPPAYVSPFVNLTGSPAGTTSYGHVGSDLVSSSAYYDGATYMGVVDINSNSRVIAYLHATQSLVVGPAVTNLSSDIHCTPSVLVRQSDHKLVMAQAAHSSIPAVHMYVSISNNPEDVSSWPTATDIKTSLGGTAYTYPHLVQLSGESGKIYLFYRDEQDAGTSAALCYSTSTDGGVTWSSQTTVYKNSGKQSYWAIADDGTSRIDIVTTDGNASDGDTASVYHFYYSGGTWHKSDGTTITLPLAPANLTKIYDGATNGHARAIYSVVGGSSPVAAWTAYDPAGAGSNIKYWYATYVGGTWTANSPTDQGSPPATGFTDGGIAIDRIDTSHVYLSKKVSGVFQMFLYATSDGGTTWDSRQLTSDTGSMNLTYNIRPVTPFNTNGRLRCFWCFGPHFTYLDGGGETIEVSASQIRSYPPRTTI